MNVFILCTCLNRELLAKTLTVFNSIRVGFPTANINVCGNSLSAELSSEINDLTLGVGGRFVNFKEVSHGAWIESLIASERDPFWIVDGDITFHSSIESWQMSPEALFAGRYEPEFQEPWTQSKHVARLHPSMMWINPSLLRAAMRSWPGKHPFFNSVQKELVQWSFVPLGGRLIFYDTCAGLYHAFGGTYFTAEQNDCFSHRFAGTYSDLMGVSEEQLKMHEAVCKSSTPDKFYGERT